MRLSLSGFPKQIAVLAVALMIGMPTVTHADDGRLATKKLQKAAAACQNVIAQVGAKVRAGKFKALDACANAALTCVQTKQTDGGCLAKAGQACAKKLGAATAALSKAKAKIAEAKSCAVELRLPDLMSSDGLGFGRVVGSCQTDFGLEVCGGIEPLAECLVRARDRAAGIQYGEASPRTAELLDVLPTALPAVAGLPDFTGCDDCSVAVGDRKAVEQCGKALTKATAGLVAGLDKVFGGCAQKVFACVQSNDPASCRDGAAGGCSKGAGKVDAALQKFAAAVAKKCGAGTIDFARLADPTGLNLAALAAVCPATPASAESLAACVQQRSVCTTAAQSRDAFSRLEEFGTSGYLGQLGSRVTGSCSAVAATATLPRGARAFFGSMGKFMKGIRRPGGFAGTLTPGARPPTSLGAGRGVTRVTGPVRVVLGKAHKIPFQYKIGGQRSAAAAGRLLEEPPKLIVTVQRADVVLDDHFEIELGPVPAVETEVNDEIEITYQDDIPGCAFTLALATKVDGVVSEDTPLLQVVDVAQPTPVATPSGKTARIAGSSDGLLGFVDVAVDKMGNAYAAGAASNNVLEITPGGKITEIIDAAGAGGGKALTKPSAVAVDGVGNVFVAGEASNNVFKITSGGAITEIINTSGDGAGNVLLAPAGLAVAGDGSVYVSGGGSGNLFEITTGGVITEIADAASGPGLGVAYGVATDEDGDVYVSAVFSLFKISEGAMTEIIGMHGDGAGNDFGGQGKVAVDGDGNVYATSALANKVFKVTPGGTISVIIGPDGDGAGHALGFPYSGLAVDAANNVYVTGLTSRNAFQITPDGAITQILDPSGDGKPANFVGAAVGIAVDGGGNTFVGAAGIAFRIAPD